MQFFIIQGEDDHERFKQETMNLKKKHKSELDDLEGAKQDYERKYLSELQSIKADFNRSLNIADDKYKLDLQAETDDHASKKLDLEARIERDTDTIKQLKNESVAREAQFVRTMKEELNKKENEMSIQLDKEMEETKESMNHNFVAQLNMTETDLQFQIETSNRECEALEIELERVKQISRRNGKTNNVLIKC